MKDKNWEDWNRVRSAWSTCRSAGRDATTAAGTRAPDDQWAQAGRLYVTSLSLLTLEVYYRYLPLYRAK